MESLDKIAKDISWLQSHKFKSVYRDDALGVETFEREEHYFSPVGREDGLLRVKVHAPLKAGVKLWAEAMLAAGLSFMSASGEKITAKQAVNQVYGKIGKFANSLQLFYDKFITEL